MTDTEYTYRPRPRRAHIKVRTTDFLNLADMVRYVSYRGVAATPEPVKVDWAGSKCTVHRIDDADGFTYLRQPSLLNRKWAEMGAARYRSFGVRAEIVLR